MVFRVLRARWASYFKWNLLPWKGFYPAIQNHQKIISIFYSPIASPFLPENNYSCEWAHKNLIKNWWFGYKMPEMIYFLWRNLRSVLLRICCNQSSSLLNIVYHIEMWLNRFGNHISYARRLSSIDHTLHLFYCLLVWCFFFFALTFSLPLG